MDRLSYPQIKADLDLCQTQLAELCNEEHNKAIMSVPPQETDFDMQISAAFDEVKAYRNTGLTPEEIKASADRRHNCKIECLLEEYNKVVAERNALKKALEMMSTYLVHFGRLDEMLCADIPKSLHLKYQPKNDGEYENEPCIQCVQEYFIQQAQEGNE